MTRPGPRRAGGYTLLDLMIAIVVVGILAAIAWPAYRGYVLRAHRATVCALLVDLAAKLEIEALRRGHYPDTFDFYLDGAGGLREEREFFVTPRGTIVGDVGDAGYDDAIYGIRLRTMADADGVPGRDYQLNARALHTQRDDRSCLELSLAASGLRGASPGRSEDCWTR